MCRINFRPAEQAVQLKISAQESINENSILNVQRLVNHFSDLSSYYRNSFGRQKNLLQLFMSHIENENKKEISVYSNPLYEAILRCQDKSDTGKRQLIICRNIISLFDLGPDSGDF